MWDAMEMVLHIENVRKMEPAAEDTAGKTTFAEIRLTQGDTL